MIRRQRKTPQLISFQVMPFTETCDKLSMMIENEQPAETAGRKGSEATISAHTVYYIRKDSRSAASSPHLIMH